MVSSANLWQKLLPPYGLEGKYVSSLIQNRTWRWNYMLYKLLNPNYTEDKNIINKTFRLNYQKNKIW